MPTYQTTPYISWAFPDQAIQMNRKGVQPLREVAVPKQDMIVGASSYWDAPTREMARQRLVTNRSKEQGMLGHKDTTDRSQRHKNNASQSQSHFNGRFMAPSYEYTQTPSGLRGGTGLITPEGRAWGKQQLLNRIKQLDAIETGNYSGGPTARTNLDPKLDYLDSAFSLFLDQWESGALPGSLSEAANRCVSELLKVGATIDSSKLSQYVEVVARLQVQAERMSSVEAGRYTFKDEKKAILRSVILTFNRFQTLAEEIARVINEPEAVRSRVMSEVSSRMLKGATQGAPRQPGEIPRGPFIPGGRQAPGVVPGQAPAMPFGAER